MTTVVEGLGRHTSRAVPEKPLIIHSTTDRSSSLLDMVGPSQRPYPGAVSASLVAITNLEGS